MLWSRPIADASASWLGRSVLAFLSAALLVAIVQGVRTARAEIDALKPRRWTVPRPMGDDALPDLRPVETAFANGKVLRGWLVPSKNRAAIVLVHGSQADRRQLLSEARILAGAGYGVMLFDLPGNGESDGERWQGEEQAAIVAATDLVAAELGTDRARIGALGFSSGAALVVSVANDPRLRAFVLEGCFTDAEQHKRDDYRRWGAISQWPALWIDRAYARGYDALRPIDAIAAIAPRPVLLIAGDADPVVGPEQVQRVFMAAHEPKALWIVRGAKHGDYAVVAGDEYRDRLVGFFDRALRREVP